MGTIKSLAIKNNLTMEEILNHCEEDRSYSWENYYQYYSVRQSVNRLLEAKNA